MADLSNEASCIQLTANIVSAYVRNNSVSSAVIPALISQVYLADGCARLCRGAFAAGQANGVGPTTAAPRIELTPAA
jgi:predicted transcriptional regulator